MYSISQTCAEEPDCMKSTSDGKTMKDKRCSRKDKMMLHVWEFLRTFWSILHNLEHKDNFWGWRNIMFLGLQVIIFSSISNNVLWGLAQSFLVSFLQSLQNVWPPLFQHDGGGSDIIYDWQPLGTESRLSSWMGIWYVTIQDIHSDGRKIV